MQRASTGAFGGANAGEQVSQRFSKALWHPIALQQRQVRARFVGWRHPSDCRAAQAPCPYPRVEVPPNRRAGKA